MLTPEQKEIAERLAELLSQSTLDDSIKENIIDHLDQLPEEYVVKLVETLETENDQLEKVASDIDAYLTEQSAGWAEVENQQKNFVDDFVDKMSQALEDQAQVQELKESL